MKPTARVRFVVFIFLICVFTASILVFPVISRQPEQRNQRSEMSLLDGLTVGPRLARALHTLATLQINESYSLGGFKPIITPTIEDTHFALMALSLLDRLDQVNFTSISQWISSGYDQSQGTITNAHPSFRIDLGPLVETALALDTLAQLNQTALVNATVVVDFIKSCERSNGGFSSDPDNPYPELTCTFFALLALQALKRVDLVNTTATSNYLAQKQHLDPTRPLFFGGFSNLSTSKPNALQTWQSLQALYWLGEINQINVTAATGWILGTQRNDSLFAMKRDSTATYDVIEATGYQLASLDLLQALDLINTTSVVNTLIPLQFPHGGFCGAPSIEEDDVAEVRETYAGIWSVATLNRTYLLDTNQAGRWLCGTFQSDGGAGALSESQGTTLTTFLVIQGIASAGEVGSTCGDWIEVNQAIQWLLSCINEERASFTPTNGTILRSTIEFSPSQGGAYHIGVFHTAAVIQSLNLLGNLSALPAELKASLVNEIINCQIVDNSIMGFGGFSIINRSTNLVNPSLFAHLETTQKALTVLNLFNATNSIINHSALIDFLLSRYNATEGLFCDPRLGDLHPTIYSSKLGVECLFLLNATHRLNVTAARNAALSYLDSSNLREMINAIQVLMYLNSTAPTILDKTQILTQIRAHQTRLGWITPTFGDEHVKECLRTTSECLDLLAQLALITEWDTPLHLNPQVTDSPTTANLGETIFASVRLLTELGDSVSVANVTVHLLNNTELPYNHTTGEFAGFFTIPITCDLLGTIDILVRAESPDFLPGNVTIPLLITGHVNLTIIEPPASLAVAPEGTSMVVYVALVGGSPLDITNLWLSTQPITPYIVNDLGYGKAQVSFDLTGVNGAFFIEIKGTLRYCTNSTWNTTLSVLEDGIIVYGNATTQQVTVKEEFSWSCLIYTFENASLTNEIISCKIRTTFSLIYQRNITFTTPPLFNWSTIYNYTGVFELELTIQNSTQRRGATLKVQIVVEKISLNLYATSPSTAQANETVNFNGTLSHNNSPPEETLEVQLTITNGFTTYTLNTLTSTEGLWVIEWQIPASIEGGDYVCSIDLTNNPLYQAASGFVENISIHGYLVVDIQLSSAIIVPGEVTSIIVYAVDLRLNSVAGIVTVQFHSEQSGWVASTNTPFEIEIPTDLQYGWAYLDVNISTASHGQIQKQISLWVGVKSEIEFSEYPPPTMPIGEPIIFKFKIVDSLGRFLRFYNITFLVEIDDELVLNTVAGSHLDGVCELLWFPPTVGNWNLTFVFSGKNQYSPVSYSTIINITRMQVHLSLVSYSYSTQGSEESITIETRLTTISGDPIPHGNITVCCNGTYYAGITDSFGHMILSIDTRGFAGLLNITLEYLGSETCVPTTAGPYLIPASAISLSPDKISIAIIPASIMTSVISLGLIILRKRKIIR